MEPATSKDETSTRNQYRTASGYQMDDRKLLLRGGIHDGQSWTGVVAVGNRVFCGKEDAWSTEGIYLVTDRVEITSDGEEVSVAVPAFG